ncbi:MAG: ROK family protein, partial [Bacteroidales bacterium]|nr:ROK family protein [Bacteroidales bacterium]
MKYAIGLDIGGTKCAVSAGICADGGIRIAAREAFPTAGLHWQEVLAAIEQRIRSFGSKLPDFDPAGIGISCGGPLDSERGVVLSPPNLPGWDEVPVVSYFRDRFNIPVHLQNDANACAWAEYRYVAGRGTRNMVFMTFGTGSVAGLVING